MVAQDRRSRLPGHGRIRRLHALLVKHARLRRHPLLQCFCSRLPTLTRSSSATSRSPFSRRWGTPRGNGLAEASCNVARMPDERHGRPGLQRLAPSLAGMGFPLREHLLMIVTPPQSACLGRTCVAALCQVGGWAPRLTSASARRGGGEGWPDWSKAKVGDDDAGCCGGQWLLRGQWRGHECHSPPTIGR